MSEFIEGVQVMGRLFFDLTANEGWNGVAIVTYIAIGMMALCGWAERKR